MASVHCTGPLGLVSFSLFVFFLALEPRLLQGIFIFIRIHHCKLNVGWRANCERPNTTALGLHGGDYAIVFFFFLFRNIYQGNVPIIFSLMNAGADLEQVFVLYRSVLLLFFFLHICTYKLFYIPG
jgi:hypothetical protein